MWHLLQSSSVHHRVLRRSPVWFLNPCWCRKTKDRGTTRGTIQQCSSHFFFSACLFWWKNMKEHCVTKDTHVSYTSNWVLSHIICKMRGPGKVSEDGKGQKCGVVRFSLLLSCVNTALQFQKATHATPRRRKPVSNWHLFMDSVAARQKFLYIKKKPFEYVAHPSF